LVTALLKFPPTYALPAIKPVEVLTVPVASTRAIVLFVIPVETPAYPGTVSKPTKVKYAPVGDKFNSPSVAAEPLRVRAWLLPLIADGIFIVCTRVPLTVYHLPLI
jgi:hypothetical protein